MTRIESQAAFSDGHWHLPAQFNFARDVVETLARGSDRAGMLFVEASGGCRGLSFAEIAAASGRWANLLRSRGVGAGAPIMVLVGKRPEWHAVLLAVMKCGAISIPCSEMLRARDLAFRASHARARLIVCERSAEDEIRNMRERIEHPLDVLFLDEAEGLLGDQPDSAPTCDTAASDPAFILYTSGTTKNPKGAVHTHGYCFAKRLQAAGWLGAPAADLVWCTAGTGWAKSIWNVLLGPWSQGAAVVLHESGFDPAERFALIEELKPTVICQAPTEYRLMAKLEGHERYNLSGVRHAVSAGEPLNPEVIRTFREAFDVTIRDGYGQTENSLLVGNYPGMDIRPGSMGCAAPGHDVRIIDGEGVELTRGEEGDIALNGRPPTLFSGYHASPEETASVFRGDWYVTGDRGTRDDDDYFWFTGRADDVILSAAYRIGPFEVESALIEHEAVAESAVVGKPDPDRGQIVKAFVVLRAGRAGTDELAKAIQDHVKRVTAPYKYPREIEFVESLPKTRSGKIRRVELRRLEGERSQGRPAID
jgi:acyl-coenzyme A synthetase/AMP-(fatty) acid ligase